MTCACPSHVQSTLDERALPIEKVGIRGVHHPLIIRSATGNFPSVGTFEMDVALPAHLAYSVFCGRGGELRIYSQSQCICAY